MDPLARTRTARKEWRCVTAEPFKGYDVLGTFDGRETLNCCYGDEAEAQRIADRMRRRGPYANREAKYDTITITPRPNPEHSNRAPGCTPVIRPGDRYVEYLDVMPWESGVRYCLACGTATFADAA